VRADLRAHARPVTDPDERRKVFTEVIADLNQPSNPGTIAQPAHLADWLRVSRLVEVAHSAAGAKIDQLDRRQRRSGPGGGP